MMHTHFTLGLITYLIIICGHSTKATDFYNDTGPVVKLFAGNFGPTIIDSPNSWVIEFYSSRCATCQEFASSYVLFAEDIAGEQHHRLNG